MQKQVREQELGGLSAGQRYHLAQLIRRRDEYKGLSIEEMLARMDAVDSYQRRVH